MTESAAVPDTSSPTGRSTLSPVARRAARAGFVGTFIEYFDFMLFSAMLVYFSPIFFPSDNPSSSFLTGLAVFGGGYIARPLGGILLGRLGDRRGRRFALVLSVLIMGISSALVGLLPGYATIGLLAPVLLVVLRLAQGVSAGGEIMSAVTYVLESAPPEKRGRLASMAPLGASVGATVGTVFAGVLAAFLGAEQMSAYGWRIPFLVTIPLTIIAFLVRRSLEDSPEYQALVAERAVSKSPIREALRGHSRKVILGGMVAVATQGITTVPSWLTVYLIAQRGLPGSQVFLALAAALAVSIFAVRPAGILGDRIGRKKVIAGILVAFIVLSVPILFVLSTTTGFIGLFLALAVYQSLGGAIQPPVTTMISENFPAPVRATAGNISFTIGILGSAFAPTVAALLAGVTGSGVGVAIWICAIAVLALVGLSMLKESAFRFTDQSDQSEPTTVSPGQPDTSSEQRAR